MLSELGMSLFDKNNSPLEPLPINYTSVKNIIWNKPELPFKIDLVTDVNNPLLGAEGASHVYGKQKGLTPLGIKIVDSGFKNIINTSIQKKIIKETDFISGSGGGLAAGFQLFLNARLISSAAFITNDLGIKKDKNINSVIVGEGKFDTQSFMDKASGTIIKKFANTKTIIFLVCGTVDKKVLHMLPPNVYPIALSKFFKNKSDSIKNYKKGIQLASREILKEIYTSTSF